MGGEWYAVICVRNGIMLTVHVHMSWVRKIVGFAIIANQLYSMC